MKNAQTIKASDLLGKLNFHKVFNEVLIQILKYLIALKFDLQQLVSSR